VSAHSFAGGLDHPCRCVDSGDLRTALPQLDGKLAITAADIEDCPSTEIPDQVQN
jgi:hypothetical protein